MLQQSNHQTLQCGISRNDDCYRILGSVKSKADASACKSIEGNVCMLLFWVCFAFMFVLVVLLFLLWVYFWEMCEDWFFYFYFIFCFLWIVFSKFVESIFMIWVYFWEMCEDWFFIFCFFMDCIEQVCGINFFIASLHFMDGKEQKWTLW